MSVISNLLYLYTLNNTFILLYLILTLIHTTAICIIFKEFNYSNFLSIYRPKPPYIIAYINVIFISITINYN